MTTERVQFQFLEMPCCKQQVCWINPRLPNYCPECGTSVLLKIRSCIIFSDRDATVSYSAE